METETVVDKAVAYVKDILGMEPSDRAPDVVANPEFTDTSPEITSEDAMRLDPHAYAFSKIVERSRLVDAQEKIRDVEAPEIATDEHARAAEQVDSAKGSLHKALDNIQDVSRGLGETHDTADMPRDDDKVLSDKEAEEAVAHQATYPELGMETGVAAAIGGFSSGAR